MFATLYFWARVVAAILVSLALPGRCAPAPQDVALRIKAGPDGSSAVGFKVQQLPQFAFVSADGNLEFGSGNRTLLHISGPSSEGNKSLAASAAKRKSYAKDGQGTLLPGGEPASIYAKVGDKNIAKSPRIAKDISLPGTLDVTGAIATTPSGLFQVFGRPQWKMIVFDSFDAGSVTGWSNTGTQTPIPINNGVSVCSQNPSPSSDFFLGAYQDLQAEKTFALPVHTRVQIRMRVHFIDKWEGESFYVRVGGQYVYSRAHTWCANDKVLVEPCLAKQSASDQRFGINVCGDPNYPDTLSTLVSFQLSHSEHVLKVGAGANLGNNTAASWGIDDFSISVQ